MIYKGQVKLNAPITADILSMRLPKQLFIFFLALQFLLSLDFGGLFVKSMKYKIISKCFTLLPALCILIISTYIYLLRLDDSVSYRLLGLNVQYIFVVGFLFFCKAENNFCIFLKKMLLRDINVSTENRFWTTDMKLIWCTISYLVIKFISAGLHCFLKTTVRFNTLSVSFMVFLVVFSMEIPLILYFFLFYFVAFQIKRLKLNVKHNEEFILPGILQYKYLIDSTEKAKGVFDYIVSIIYAYNKFAYNSK